MVDDLYKQNRAHLLMYSNLRNPMNNLLLKNKLTFLWVDIPLVFCYPLEETLLS